MLTTNKSTKRNTWASSVGELEALGTDVSYDGSERYTPLQNHTLAGTVLTQLEQRGYQVESESYGVVHGGTGMLGSVVVTAPEVIQLPVELEERAAQLHAHSRHIDPLAPLPADMRLSVGYRHDNRGDWALKFAFGAQVIVCENGMVVATGPSGVNLRRQHVGEIDLDAMIGAGLDRFGAHLGAVAHVRGTLAERDLSNAEGDALIVQAGREGVVPWTRCREVADQWHTPNHPEFQDRNAWSLFNAFTEAVKAQRPEGQWESLERVTGFLAPEAANLLGLN